MSRPTNPTILPDPTLLQLVRLEAEEQFILVVVATTSLEAYCPLCQSRSESVHSRYVRLAADLPWAGWAVRLELHVRRFFCQNNECVPVAQCVSPISSRSSALPSGEKQASAWWMEWD